MQATCAQTLHRTYICTLQQTLHLSVFIVCRATVPSLSKLLSRFVLFSITSFFRYKWKQSFPYLFHFDHLFFIEFILIFLVLHSFCSKAYFFSSNVFRFEETVTFHVTTFYLRVILPYFSYRFCLCKTQKCSSSWGR